MRIGPLLRTGEVVPRVAAIEHPFGRPYGDVGDVETQRAVLLASLELARRARAGPRRAPAVSLA